MTAPVAARAVLRVRVAPPASAVNPVTAPDVTVTALDVTGRRAPGTAATVMVRPAIAHLEVVTQEVASVVHGTAIVGPTESGPLEKATVVPMVASAPAAGTGSVAHTGETGLRAVTVSDVRTPDEAVTGRVGARVMDLAPVLVVTAAPGDRSHAGTTAHAAGRVDRRTASVAAGPA